MADTQMQREIREKHEQAMGDHHRKFTKLRDNGELLKPEQPGHVIAKLALEGGTELSGQFLTYTSSFTISFKDLETDWDTVGTMKNWLLFRNNYTSVDSYKGGMLNQIPDIPYPYLVRFRMKPYQYKNHRRGQKTPRNLRNG